MKLSNKIISLVVLGAILVLGARSALGGGAFHTADVDESLSEADSVESKGAEWKSAESKSAESKSDSASAEDFESAGEIEQSPPYSSPGESPNANSDTDEILARLKDYEQSLLDNKQIQHIPASVAAADEADKRSTTKLAEEKRALEEKQDQYISQIVELTRKVKELSRNIDLKSETDSASSKQLAAAIERARLAEQELAQLRENADRLSVVESERDQTKAKFDKLLGTAKKLEAELQRRKAVEEENSELVVKVNQLNEKLAKSEEAKKAAAGSQSALEEARNQVEALRLQKEELLREVSEAKGKLARATEDREALEKQKDAEFVKLRTGFDRSRTLLENLKASKEGLENQLVELQQDLKVTEEERDKLQNRAAATSAEVSEANTRNDALKEQLATANKDLRGLQGRLSTFDEMTKKVAALESETKSQQEELKGLKVQAQKVEQLQSDLVRARSDRTRLQNQLLLRDTELGQTNSPTAGATAAAVPPTPEADPSSVPALTNEAMVVQVKVAKASLRVGPGKEHSVLMDVQRGTKLVVEAREGEWYRVFTPTNQRAYIQTSLVEDERSATRTPAPAKPAARVVTDESALIPFGKVNGATSGRSRPAVKPLPVDGSEIDDLIVEMPSGGSRANPTARRPTTRTIQKSNDDESAFELLKEALTVGKERPSGEQPGE